MLENKLKLLKNDLKKWNVEVFGNVEEQGKQLWKDLSEFETIEEIHGLTEEEKKDLERIRGSLKKLLFWKKYVGGKKLEYFVLEKEIGI